MAIRDFLAHLNEMFTFYFVFPSIVLLGIYLTFALKFVQISKLKMSFSLLFKKQAGGEGDISHYQAVASVLAGNFGTGNISGMAVALMSGGPGALVWMWVMTFLGSAIQFASCLLGVKYRQKGEYGEFVGGPMYYLSHVFKKRSIGIFFSCFVIMAAFTVGNFAQVNSIAIPLQTLGIAPWVVGVAIAIFVGIVVIGGASRVAHVSAAVVPFMAFLYLSGAIVILGFYWEGILSALQIMIVSAFSKSSFAGGILGFSIMKALSTGFNRAIFATDAGTGTVPILQSGAKTKDPVIDGVVSLVAPIMVMIVCTITGLVLIVTGAFQEIELQSTNMVMYAFQAGIGKTLGSIIVLVALVLFGYTTLLAWATCLERAVGFVFGQKMIRFFQILYILIIPVGAILRVDLVWILADLALTSMMVLNLIGVAFLSKEVIADSERFFSSKVKPQVELEI